MQFHYTASDQGGKIIEGDTEANSTREVIGILAGQGLTPIAIKKIGEVEAGKAKKLFTKAITLQDKVFLTKYLSLMMKAGTDLYRAIDILADDFDKQSVKSFLVEIKDSLVKGQPFYTAFARYPKFFSPVFVNMIKAGEASGTLADVLADLSVRLEEEDELRKKIKGALIYPTILISLSFLIMLLLVSFALPRIAETFLSTQTEPPLFSKIVFTVGLFFGKYIYIILPLIGGMIVGGYLFFARSTIGHKYFDRIVNKTPLIKDVILRASLQQFTSTLSALLKAGLPIITSLEITADAVRLPELRAAILRVAHEGVAKGKTLGEAFQNEAFFPRVVVNLISVSEKTGNMEEMLDSLAKFYKSEIESSIKILLSFIEPILLLVIGGIIGVIALAIIVPIYQLIGTV